jgi:small subunit ribosomal protein S17e
MGRIKTQLIKRTTLELYGLYQDKFTGTFDENKKIVAGLVDCPSKKLKNLIAGYVTRLKRASSQ